MLRSLLLAAGCLMLLPGCGSGGGSAFAEPKNAKNVVFFLGDGLGITTMTAARIYKVGEDGDLTIDTLPETAFVKTYSNDAQVTDSAAAMSAYMTGVKTNNDVVSMTSDTVAFDASGNDYANNADSTCPSGNGHAVTTLLELAKAAGLGTGVVTTTRITHATPAATYAHVCHRDGENTIAAQMTPGGAGYNTALGDGIDVILGGGRRHFLPKGASGSKRSDVRDLLSEMKAGGYTYVSNRSEFNAAAPGAGQRLLGLFTLDHMAYDLDRDATQEPSLAEMTGKAIDVLKNNGKGFFLMVEGGRIDHALHNTNAARALQDTIAFDDAVKAAIDKLQSLDPGLKNTLIVVTADHDHTLVLNGYAKRTGPTTAFNPGVLGLLKNIVSGTNATDSGGHPFTIIGFGNGENRPATRATLMGIQVADKNYHQEAAIPMGAGGETHGGTDVLLGAIGKGAENFAGIIENNEVFGLMRKSIGL